MYLQYVVLVEIWPKGFSELVDYLKDEEHHCYLLHGQCIRSDLNCYRLLARMQSNTVPTEGDGYLVSKMLCRTET